MPCGRKNSGGSYDFNPMPVFQYKARASDGNITKGLVEAPTKEVAAKLLHEKQLFVINVSETGKQLSFGAVLQRFSRVGFAETVNFTRQLSTMVIAGLTLPESLTILRSQTTNTVFSQMLQEVEHQIVSGGNLADALSKYPQYFSSTYIALVRAGEASGTLDQVLARLADILESQREFRAKIKGAMIYPIIIVIGMIAVVFVMMTMVVPKLTDLYKDFNIDLPASTRLLMAVSQFFVSYWWLLLLVGVGAGAGFSKWRKTPEGELLIDTLILKIPLFGELQKKIILTEFTRTLGMLTASGIHILEGLRILKGSLGNVVFRNAITDVAKKVEKGFALGETFAQYPVFPPIVPQMMKVGEETGKLDDTLMKLSRYFESESEHMVKGLTTAIEPIIMIMLGVGVGFIVISVITPIYNLTSQFK